MTSKERVERIENFIDGSPITKEYRESLNADVKEIRKDLEELEKYRKVMCKPIVELMKNLERLEAIDNAKPSDALEILETFNGGLLNKEIGAISYNQIWLENQIEALKQALLKAQQQEKILEIIFKKTVDIILLDASITVEDYNCLENLGDDLTQEEFDLLKEPFKK